MALALSLDRPQNDEGSVIHPFFRLGEPREYSVLLREANGLQFTSFKGATPSSTLTSW